MKSAGFFTWEPYKSTNSTQILQFHGVLGEGYVSEFHENPPLFTEIRTKDHQLPEMVTPMFSGLDLFGLYCEGIYSLELMK